MSDYTRANSQENAWTHVWMFRRIHLWSGRNYKYVEQNPHIGQLAKVTDVELLHYIMPALSPSLKMIALELFFFILQTLPIIPNLVFTSTTSLPADYHSSGTIEFCNFDRFQHQHFKCIIWKKHVIFLPGALLVGRKNFWKKGMSGKNVWYWTFLYLCYFVHKDKLFLPGHGVQQDLMQEGWVNYILKNPLFSDTWFPP